MTKETDPIAFLYEFYAKEEQFGSIEK